MGTRVGAGDLRGTRIVVIGAGAVGSALSYRLAQAGADVTTVERRFPGAGTSGNSFAWLNGFSKTPRNYHRLNVMSIRDHEDLADELNGDWVHVNGALHWARDDDPTQMAVLRQAIKRLQDWGVHVDTMTPQVVMSQLEPDIRIDPGAVSEVHLVQREGWLDAATMTHRVMHAASVRYGAKFERATVTALGQRDRTVKSVVLEDGRELSAELVINAAGPEAGRIGALAGVRIPLDRKIGMLISTAPAPICLRHVLYGAGAHIRPDGGARLLIHGEHMDDHAIEGESVGVDAAVVQRAMAEARTVLPGLIDVPAEAVRVGIRPVPRDGQPIVGFEPTVSGLYTVVTHSGITLAARLAVLVTEELRRGEVTELAPYRPSRFSDDAPPTSKQATSGDLTERAL